MKTNLQFATGIALGAFMLTSPAAFAGGDKIVVGFATAASGFMQAYDKPAQDAAMIRIDAGAGTARTTSRHRAESHRDTPAALGAAPHPRGACAPGGFTGGSGALALRLHP